MIHKKNDVFATSLKVCAFAALIVWTVAAQDLKVEEPPAAAHVGDVINVSYHVVNTGGTQKKFTCMLSFDPPTGQKAHCKVQNITLDPGESYYGSLEELVELAVNSRVTVKLLDENQNIISEQSFPVKIVEAGRIVCGDLLCDLGENNANCPRDCPTGVRDGYCDKEADGKCDPDCLRTEDSDCICNSDGYCDFLLGENHGNCAGDCPPGVSDGYCDKEADGKCDPDCSSAEDPDCKIEEPPLQSTADNGFIPYLAGCGILIVFLAVVVFILYRRNQEAMMIEKERAEYNKWNERSRGT